MKKNGMFIDFYYLFSLDRSMTEKEIKKKLSRRQAEVSRLQGSTNRDDTETLKELQETMEYLRAAIQILSREESRKEYDTQLDAASKAGKVNREVAKEVHDILARARAFFEKGQYNLALKHAQEALDNHINGEEPYEIISRSYFMMGDYDEALETVGKATDIYTSSLYLRWLNIRFSVMTENFNEAQDKLNKAMDDFNSHSQLAAEQVYLYGYAERDDLLKTTIDSYIRANPNDADYRKYVAYNLVEISQQCYVYDSNAEMMLLTEEDSYNRCLNLVMMANSIYQDEYVQNELNYVQKFGETVFDDDHKGLKWFYRLSGIAAIIVGIINFSSMLEGKGSWPLVVFLIGILFQGAVFLVNKVSYRPYWKVYRDYYRGFKESDDGALYNILVLPWELVKQIFGSFFG